MTIEEKKLLEGIQYPSIMIRDDYRVQAEVLDFYNRFSSIMTDKEIKIEIEKYLRAKYGSVETTGKYLPFDIDTWLSTQRSYHMKCSCGWECPWDKRHFYHYCVNCGKLLPYNEKVTLLNDSYLRQLKKKISDYELKDKEESSIWNKIKKTIF